MINNTDITFISSTHIPLLKIIVLMKLHQACSLALIMVTKHIYIQPLQNHSIYITFAKPLHIYISFASPLT